jgi:hypothetical protein
MPIDPNGTDNRITYKQAVPLLGASGSLSVDVYGSSTAVGSVQVSIFDNNDAILSAVGWPPYGAPLTTENNGRASWLFSVPENAAYMTWSVTAGRIALGQDAYSVTAKVRNSNGDALAVSQFSALFASDKFADDTYYDGVNFQQTRAAVPATPAAQRVTE